MALTGTFLFRGVSVPQAYVQARGMMLTSKSEIRGHAIIWASLAESQNPEGQPFDYLTFDFELTDLSVPIYTAAYAALKAMPQFANFQDC